jgi:hypothetical protein
MRHTKLLMSSVVLAALAFTGSACAVEGAGQPKTSASPQATPKTAAKTVIYYFHGTSRCQTCRTIEAYADEAVKAAFGPELARGELLWQPLNVDESANEHFVKDYQLFTRSLVVVDGANPKRFKNLERVWQLVGDKPVFMRYVQDEVRAFGKSQG